MEPGTVLKRPRGLDGGLEDLGAGLQLGSPDRKKSKGSTQGIPRTSLRIHPAAQPKRRANSFDDSYTTTYKPTAGPYFTGPAYPGFGGYNAFRMPSYLLSRVASPYGAPAFPLRHQLPPFNQSPVGTAFSRPPAVTFENVMGFGHQPSYSASQALPR